MQLVSLASNPVSIIAGVPDAVSPASDAVNITPQTLNFDSAPSVASTVVENYTPREFVSQALDIGNKPVLIFEADVESCSHVYGDAATGGQCRAVLNGPNHEGLTFTRKCVNAYKNCQDRARFARVTKTIRLIEAIHGLPTRLGGEPVGLPCIISNSADPSPPTITQGRGLGRAASNRIRCRDFRHNDVGFDPYVHEREDDPENTGTFWPKQLARYYFEHRDCRTKVIYLDQENDLGTARVAHYQIDEVSLNDRDSSVEIRMVDRLKLAGAGVEGNEPSLVPAPIDVSLTADIDEVATAIDVSGGAALQAAFDTEPGNINVVQIGDEQIRVGAVSNNSCAILERGYGGSEIDDHSADDGVQACAVFDDNVVDILRTLILRTPLSVNNIPQARWDSEKNGPLSIYDFTRSLGRPTSVEELIQELSEVALFDIWLEPETNMVEIKALAPPVAGQVLPRMKQGVNIERGSLTFTPRMDEQITQLVMRYAPISQASEDEENLNSTLVRADLEAESENERGLPSIRIINTHWLRSNQRSVALQSSGRLAAAYSRPPVQGRFTVHAKDSAMRIGQLFELEVDQNQDELGSTLPILAQVIARDERETGAKYEYTYRSSFFAFGTRFARWAFNTTPRYSDASEDERNSLAFWGDNTGQFNDGTDSYVWQ